jgi:hypothetical protein
VPTKSLAFATLITMAAACGSVPTPDSVDPVTDPPDAAVDAGVDAGADTGMQPPPPPAPRCDPDADFPAPVYLTQFNTPEAEYGAQLTGDEKTLFFIREGNGKKAILMATRDDARDGFTGDAVPVPGIDQSQAPWWGNPAPSPDGKLLYLTRDDGHGTRVDLYVARLENGTYSEPRKVAADLDGLKADPYVTSDGVYFNRWVKSWDLERAPRSVNGELGQAVDVRELNIETANEGRPVVSPDQTHIFWYSSRTDSNPDGAEEIWEARRGNASPSAVFTDLRHLAQLGSPKLDAPDWISPDGCELYMESDRLLDANDKDADRNLYIARKPRK